MSFHGSCRSCETGTTDIVMSSTRYHCGKSTNNCITMHLFFCSITICDVPMTSLQFTATFLQNKFLVLTVIHRLATETLQFSFISACVRDSSLCSITIHYALTYNVFLNALRDVNVHISSY